jgi:hypothetical protein
MDEKLLESIATTIADYRAGEIDAPTKEHVKQWVKQFPDGSRDNILAEMVHVLGKTYISKANVETFLSTVVSDEKLTGGDAKKFWQGAKLLEIQTKGSSQRDMLAMLAVPLKSKAGLEISDCGKTASCYVYLDDGVFSGNTILNDLKGWLAGDAPAQASVHVVIIALHRGGEYYAETKLKEAAQEHGKKIELTWWRVLTLEDRLARTNSSDVLRPTRIPDDPTTKAYVDAMKHKPTPRTGANVGALGNFSSAENRDLLEQQFLVKGAYIRTVCPHLNQYQRPLGNSLLETLGFGTTIVTYRNCPNNTPLVFWAGDPWRPLFVRKIN